MLENNCATSAIVFDLENMIKNPQISEQSDSDFILLHMIKSSLYYSSPSGKSSKHILFLRPGQIHFMVIF